MYEEECWAGSLDFCLREKRQSNTNDRIDDFLKAYKIVEQSDLKLRGVDYRELAKYVRMNLSDLRSYQGN